MEQAVHCLLERPRWWLTACVTWLCSVSKYRSRIHATSVHARTGPPASKQVTPGRQLPVVASHQNNDRHDQPSHHTKGNRHEGYGDDGVVAAAVAQC
ncbi:MAG: hypothetical protein QOC75_4895 [Pseudonocardiales bacterium]|nr:hypothetical protein [Pseudonocardiales bacterium]